jgi:PPK2 family polyphosphate:nucleotide phosphotransferase
LILGDRSGGSDGVEFGHRVGMAIRDLLRVTAGTDLDGIDPASTPGLPRESRGDRKLWARQQVAEVGSQLAELQERLFAAAKAGGDRRRVLLVLQAMDGGGKDGTVKNVIGQLNPQGVRVISFGVPTERERKHHFLWRIRRSLPVAGYVGVFNRSHYEDVLVSRVLGNLRPERITRRYDQIRRFERDLVADGCAIVKVLQHISAEEQLRRLLRRLDDPAKRWKYNPSDVDARNRWPAYQEAYQAVLTETSTVDVPWYVVPANRKWYRDWAVSHLLRETLIELDPQYPQPDLDIEHEKARLQGRSQ